MNKHKEVDSRLKSDNQPKLRDKLNEAFLDYEMFKNKFDSELKKVSDRQTKNNKDEC